MSHATGAQPVTQPASPPSFSVGSTGELWDNMVKGSAPIQMMKKPIMSVRGEPVEPHSNTTGEELWREKENLALAWLEETLSKLKGPLTSDAWLGGWGRSAKNIEITSSDSP